MAPTSPRTAGAFRFPGYCSYVTRTLPQSLARAARRSLNLHRVTMSHLTPTQHKQVRHLIAHTARILVFLAAHPDYTPEQRAEYEAQLADYREKWATVPIDHQEAIPAALIADEDLGDLTEDSVGAALEALQGA